MNNNSYYIPPIYLNSTANINCKPDEQLIITAQKVKPSRKPRPPYTTIGNGMNNRNFPSYPYEKTLLELSANEIKLYSLILDAYDLNTGYSIIDTSKVSKSDKVKLSLGYKQLKERGLVKRVKQRTYLINPTAKIHLNLFDELYETWNSLP